MAGQRGAVDQVGELEQVAQLDQVGSHAEVAIIVANFLPQHVAARHRQNADPDSED